MKQLKTAILAASLTAAISGSASTYFGSLPGATFSGSGIPNDAVEVTTATSGSGDTLTLGLAATPRYQVGELANNGNGTYYASAGTQWNFDYYVNVAGTGNISDYTFVLGYNLIPATALGSWNLNPSYPAATTTIQDSQWPGFGFLASSAYEPVIIPPTGPYNINATGDYTFVLDAYSGSTLIGQSEINVDVTPVPEPATILSAALMVLPCGASALRILRKRKVA